VIAAGGPAFLVKVVQKLSVAALKFLAAGLHAAFTATRMKAVEELVE